MYVGTHLPLSPACNMLVYSAACILSNYQTVNNNYYNQLALSRRHIKLFAWNFQSIIVVWSILSTSGFHGSDGNSIQVAFLSRQLLVQSVKLFIQYTVLTACLSDSDALCYTGLTCHLQL